MYLLGEEQVPATGLDALAVAAPGLQLSLPTGPPKRISNVSNIGYKDVSVYYIYIYTHTNSIYIYMCKTEFSVVRTPVRYPEFRKPHLELSAPDPSQAFANSGVCRRCGDGSGRRLEVRAATRGFVVLGVVFGNTSLRSSRQRRGI